MTVFLSQYTNRAIVTAARVHELSQVEDRTKDKLRTHLPCPV